MTHAERYAWLSLVAWTGIMFFLLMKFTDGVEILGQSIGLTIVEQSAGKLLWTYVTLAVVAIVAESIIASILAARAGNASVERDERDVAIEARANLTSYWFMAAALNVIVIHVLANAAYGGHTLPQLNLTSLTGVAFALLFVLTAAEIVKRIAIIWNYRTA
jgi:amino acid permease